MSQALFERAAGGHHEGRSAGTTPGGRVHPEVVVETVRATREEIAQRVEALVEELDRG